MWCPSKDLQNSGKERVFGKEFSGVSAQTARENGLASIIIEQYVDCDDSRKMACTEHPGVVRPVVYINIGCHGREVTASQQRRLPAHTVEMPPSGRKLYRQVRRARSSHAGGNATGCSTLRRTTGWRRIEAFAQGHFNLLILVGSGGLAKSRSVRAALGGIACWIEGNATPFGMYVKLYRHRDEFVVIDDVDALYADRSGVRLLKCLCQTEEEKSVAWHSDARAWRSTASRGSSPPQAGWSSSPTTGRRSTRTWRRSRTAGMC